MKQIKKAKQNKAVRQSREYRLFRMMVRMHQKGIHRQFDVDRAEMRANW